jgi:hypothetical protein
MVATHGSPDAPMSPAGAKRPNLNPSSFTFKRNQMSPAGAKRPNLNPSSFTIERDQLTPEGGEEAQRTRGVIDQ